MKEEPEFLRQKSAGSLSDEVNKHFQILKHNSYSDLVKSGFLFFGVFFLCLFIFFSFFFWPVELLSART